MLRIRFLHLVVGWFAACGSAWSDEAPREMLRRRLENASIQAPMRISSDLVLATRALPRFYEARGFELAWDGRANAKHVDALVAAIRDAGAEGLDPRDYHVDRIETIRARLGASPSDPAVRVDLDLLCTDAFLVYAAHLVSGFVDPETIDPEWSANRREVELTEVLRRGLQAGDVRGALESLLPEHRGYAALKQALGEMRKLVERGGWELLATGPKLEVGMREPRVRQLRARLAHGGNLSNAATEDADHFDETLRSAVIRFQARHGLEVDGIVGPATLAVLNVPASERLRQIVINLERWRWLPQDLGERYILVNVPAFHAVVVERGEAGLEMRAVVGRQYRRTPVFSARMTYLVLSPYWEVPQRIAVQDKLPEIRKDPGYLGRQGMRIYSGWGADATEVAPESVDWARVSATHFPYRLRQDPGPLNALGRAKFMFPNKHNVYLHDTPQREHFERAKRSFSSGCIRIDRPLELAAYLLSDQADWSLERIRRVVEQNVPTTVTLRQSMPVHLLYWTAWADEDGTLHFREDVYGRDQRLSQALRSEPPEALRSEPPAP